MHILPAEVILGIAWLHLRATVFSLIGLHTEHFYLELYCLQLVRSVVFLYLYPSVQLWLHMLTKIE